MHLFGTMLVHPGILLCDLLCQPSTYLYLFAKKVPIYISTTKQVSDNLPQATLFGPCSPISLIFTCNGSKENNTDKLDEMFKMLLDGKESLSIQLLILFV
jgi:hypothetical protein